MTVSALLVSAFILFVFYRPCIFTVEPYCRGLIPAGEVIIETVSGKGLAFNPVDQSASALIGSYIGFVLTSTILLDELASRLLFYYNHRNQ